MGDHARHKTNNAAQRTIVPSSPSQRQGRRGSRSNFIEVLVEARGAEHRSVHNLAEMAGVTPAAIRKLEAGTGPVTTLVAVMAALPFQSTVLAPAASFGEQLRNLRMKVGMPLEMLAAKSALSPDEIIELEGGGGSVENLLRLLSVVAPKVKRRAPERVYWGSDKKAARDSRFTPPEFMQSIYRAFGPVSLDPCAHRASPVVARRRFFLDQGDDGLIDRWSGRLVFVNPPFSGVLAWLRKAHDEWAAGHVATVVCVVPVRTDSVLFQDIIKPKADIYFLRGRLRFGQEGGKSEPTPHSLMVVIFGATAKQKARFAALVRGFWAPANDRQAIMGSSDAEAGFGWSLRMHDRRIHFSSCAAHREYQGGAPARVCCGPALQEQGGAR